MWHYVENGQQLGPISNEDLKKRADDGLLKPDDMIWKEGMKAWAAAKSLKGLFPVAPPPVPMPSAPPPISVTPSVSFEVVEPTAPPKFLPFIPQFIAGLHRQRFVLAVAAGIGMFSAVLPWYGPLSGFTVGEGWAAIILFLPTMIFCFLNDKTKSLESNIRWIAVITAGLASLFGISVVNKIPGGGGIGLYLMILSGLVINAAAFLLATSESD